MKKCKTCGELKEESDLASFRRCGKVYYRSQCRPCEAKRAVVRRQRPEAKARAHQRYLRRRASRARGEDPDKWILYDSRKSDRKRGRENDLDREFIATQIEKGCVYCGETSIRMTLDRIDNEKGHVRLNVVPACLRCNYVRGNMPHSAWLVVAKGMRAAREAGLFGGWTGRVR